MAAYEARPPSAALDLLVRRRLSRREQIAVRHRIVLADRTVERRNGTCRDTHLLHLLERKLRLLRNLSSVGARSSVASSLAPARDTSCSRSTMCTDPNHARLVRNAALHRPADPPGRVRRELEALRQSNFAARICR
jgi:hypothetical protein